MAQTPPSTTQLVTEEMQLLAEHHRHEDFSHDFLMLLAGLQLHGFSIYRADEGQPTVTSAQDLWIESGHPSVCLQAAIAPTLARELAKAEPGSAEHLDYSNQIMRANLSDQRKLLVMLEAFYAKRASSAHARLIAETVELGETCLKAQGANVRVILEDPIQQAHWLRDAQLEMLDFAKFLVDKL